ncbi:Uncharacterised protein [uncultured archaeon]|nr:Uncharacterised protein [uncultured archaeon]
MDSVIYGFFIAAFFALSIDSLLQIFRVSSRESSEDVSLIGCGVRLIAGVFFLIYFYALEDIWMMLAQTLFIFVFLVYFTVVAAYREKNRHFRKASNRSLNYY